MLNCGCRTLLLLAGITACALLVVPENVLAADAAGRPAVASILRQTQDEVEAGHFDDALKLLNATLSTTTIPDDRAQLERAVSVVNQNWGSRFVLMQDYPSALDKFRQSFTLAAKIGETRVEEIDAGYLGNVYVALTKYDKALDRYQAALRLAIQSGDLPSDAGYLTNIGIVNEYRGRFDSAIDYEQKAFTLYKQLGDVKDAGDDLTEIGSAYDDLGQYGKALDAYRQALAMVGGTGSTEESSNFDNIGNVYADLGQYDKALDFQRRALAMDTKRGDEQAEGHDYNDIATVYISLSEYEEALDNEKTALALAYKSADVRGEEHKLGNLGTIDAGLGHYVEALGDYRQSLTLATGMDDRNTEEEDLNNIGQVYKDSGQYDRALQSDEDALVQERRLGDLRTEGVTLNNLMLIEQARKEPNLAIFYGKESVDTFQTIRAGVANADAAAQKTYLATVEKNYTSLADLLISQGRLAEAQQVLGLLKEQEFFQYVHPDLRQSPNRALHLDPISLTRREAKWDRLLNASNASLPDVIKKADADFAGPLGADDRLADTPQAAEIARRLAPGAALIYAIVGEAHITEIVVTPAGVGRTAKIVVRQSAPIPSTQLYKDVNRFRIALMNPTIDPRPLGRKFYDLLMAPIRGDLDGARAATLLFSLDDALRYVPIAALVGPDGAYVVQHYKTETITLIDAGDRAKARGASPTRMLGLGTSTAHSLDGDRFPALPGVARELVDIVRESGEATGVVPGERLLNGQFTLAAMTRDLASHRYDVVHVASHFAIGATDTSSYLLLGDGSGETVADLRKIPERFAGVDLLTLSACDTNEDIQTHDGHEIDGFGALMQQMGAKSVLASLWPVSDAVTPVLMQALYGYRAEHSEASTAQALRYAQLTLLTGSPEAADSRARRGPILTRDSEALPEQSSPDLPSFTPDAKAPYAHPFYWAAFVLIGDWK